MKNNTEVNSVIVGEYIEKNMDIYNKDNFYIGQDVRLINTKDRTYIGTVFRVNSMSLTLKIKGKKVALNYEQIKEAYTWWLIDQK